MDDIKELQKLLNLHEYTDANDTKLAEDGAAGPRTLQACTKCILQKGSEGDIVKWLQNTLIHKGYSCGSTGADGILGSITEETIKKFQTDKGLTVDGIVGANTWKALLEKENSALTNLQHLLNETGFTDDHGDKLVEDGIAGPKTLQACKKCILRFGNQGELVKWVQSRLIYKGYSCGSAGSDGIFGHDTYRAVKKLQYDNELTPAGKIGPWTWAALLDVELCLD